MRCVLFICHCQQYEIKECHTKMFLWRCQIAGKNETYFVVFTRSARSEPNLQSLVRFTKAALYQISWKIRPMGATLIGVDRRTGMTKLVAAFRD